MNKITAIYPGTFDPITNGHLDLVARAAQLFDEVIIAVAENKTKSPLFSLDERVALAKIVTAEFTNVYVIGFDNLLVECAKQQGARVILRGLRAVSDFEYEFQMSCVNSRLNNNIETVFLPAKDDMHFVSSRMIRSVAELDGDISQFVPKCIVRIMKDFYHKS